MHSESEIVKICITNRHLVEDDFLTQIEKVAKSDCAMIILREKDMQENEYMQLAQQVLDICRKNHKTCILHTYPGAALKLKADGIHFPLPVLLEYAQKHGVPKSINFGKIGTSVHSVEEAKKAVKCGATYLTAGHVFLTDCKKSVPARGLDFLADVCNAVNVPVYAIGGINDKNAGDCIQAGAAGVCMMSGYMS